MNYDYFAEKHQKQEGKQTCHRKPVLEIFKFKVLTV